MSNIKQRPDERYKDFVARLKTAVKKIIKSTEPTDVRTKLKPGQALRGRLGLRKAEALGTPTSSVARPIRKIPVAPAHARPEPIQIGMRGLKVPRGLTV